MKKNRLDFIEMAEILANESNEKKRRILGFGHRVHTSDPRTKRLFYIAEKMNINGNHISLSKAIERSLEKSVGKKLPINVDGAIAAIISDMGFDWRLGKAFFLIGRAAGLTAHVYEEQTDFKPMRKICDIDSIYEGLEERDLPGH